MSAPICPVNGRACPAACAGEPSCERAGAVVVRVSRAAARKQAEDAVIEAARSWAVAALNEPGRVRKCTQSLLSAVDALTALEAKE